VDHDEKMLMIKAITTAFDEHDLQGIMVHLAADAVFEVPRGSDPWGTRFVGREEIREAFASRFSGIPDIRYQHEVRGCDLWAFRNGMIVKKDSYWKLVSTG
jgi:ketosteroid isomerase-like protein